MAVSSPLQPGKHSLIQRPGTRRAPPIFRPTVKTPQSDRLGRSIAARFARSPPADRVASVVAFEDKRRSGPFALQIRSRRCSTQWPLLLVEVKLGRIMCPLAPLYRRAVPPCLAGQVHEKGSAEPTLAHQFRRQYVDVVTGGGDKVRGLVVLDPSKKLRQQS